MDIWILLFVSILAANLPWMSERFMLVISLGEKAKSIWLRLLEWLILYFIIGGMSLGLETRVTGGIHNQNWEFYVVTSCLFLVFALPGFIYRHDLKHLLDRRQRQKS